MGRPTLFALGAYCWWGLSAIFWRELQSVAPGDQLGWRVASSAVLLGVYAMVRRHRTAAGATRRELGLGLLAAVLIGANWGVFLWAVSNEQAVEASLGYFLMPLFSAGLGVAFLAEKLRPPQIVALGLAALGGLWLFGVQGELPWVALALAGTFAVYGLVKKNTSWSATEGLTVEAWLLAPVALLFLVGRSATGTGVVGDGDLRTIALLAGTGIMTTVPLVLFAAAAKKVSLVVIGLLQYLNPTLQFLVGWLAFGESVDTERVAGFSLVWIALAVIVVDELRSGAAGRASERAGTRPSEAARSPGGRS